MEAAVLSPAFARLRPVVIACAMALGAALAVTPQAAGQIHPPVDDKFTGLPDLDPAVGADGVDAATGSFTARSPGVSIGDPSSGGLSYVQIHQGSGSRHSLAGGISTTGVTGEVTVSLFGSAEKFQLVSGAWVPDRANGSSLTESSGVFTYTSRDGATAIFTELVTGDNAVMGYDKAYLTGIEFPNGRTLRYAYQSSTVSGDVARRLQSVTNNHGYQIHFEYARLAAATTAAQLADWLQLDHVRAINNAVEGCSPTASACTLTEDWPRLDIAYPSGARTFTDNLGRVTRWTFDGSDRVTGVRPPGETSDTVTIAYNTNGRVDTITRGPLTWTYTYVDTGGVRETRVSHPGGAWTRTEVTLSTGLVTAEVDARGKRTEFQYDADARITRVTAPEGDQVRYTYDSRGNVTETRRVAAPGSGLADLVTTASYPSSCTNAKTCNQPTSVTDSTGATTDFSYIATHGGPNLIQQAAPSSGADRPATGIGYDSFQAWYYDGSGTLVQDPDPVTLPDLIRQCRTGDLLTSCDGTFSEQRRQVFFYGSTGVPNNLQVSQVRVQNGGGALDRRSWFTYDDRGDLIQVDGPLSGSADSVFYRYDALRRPVGQIGIDPDGAGPRLRSASRITYDTQGRAVTQEAGTVTGVSDTAWAAFTRLQRSTVEYDVIGRPTIARAYAAGSTIEALIQYGYGTDGRLLCQARRMNPSVFSSPPSSACALGTEGADGPDRITRVDYDGDGRTVSVTTGWGTGDEIDQTTYAYTDNGRLLSLTDGAGNRTLYTYDGFDRIKEIDYAHPSSPGDNTGNDDEIFEYDTVGRLNSRRVRSNEQFVYTYDALGRVTNVNAPSGTADTSYTYDLHNNLISVSSDGRTLTNTFNALGDHLSQAGPNGTVSYLYDAAGRRERMSWPDGNYVTYDWNVASQLTHIRENGASSGLGVLAAFTYDDQGRRTALIRGNGTETSYSFDAAGRLASLVEDLSGTSADLTVSFDHNHSGQIIERSVSNAGYTYAHSITLDTLFDHNGLNQITSADDGTSVLTPSYDARGNLTSYDGRTFGYDTYNRLTSVGGTGGSMSLDYDPLGRLWETSGPSGTARYQYDGAAIIAEYNASGVMQHRWVHGPGMDEPLVRYDGSGMTNRTWLHADERGSIIAHTDSSGARTQLNTYDAFGNPGASNAGLFQYTGQVWLADASVYYYKNRTYHAELGVFMQADPIGHSGGVNLYAYVGGDPINFTDPWGLSRINNEDPNECYGTRTVVTDEDGNVIEDNVVWDNSPACNGFANLGFGGGIPGIGGGRNKVGGGGKGQNGVLSDDQTETLRRWEECNPDHPYNTPEGRAWLREHPNHPWHDPAYRYDVARLNLEHEAMQADLETAVVSGAVVGCGIGILGAAPGCLSGGALGSLTGLAGFGVGLVWDGLRGNTGENRGIPNEC